MEKEITTTNQTTALADSLIVVQQLPIIKEQLHSIKAQAQESVKEALSLACTEETLKVVKERRAALNRDRKDLDVRRMAVKKQIMQPFEDFDEVYKECVTDVYGPADEALKGKITDVEAGLKADKEKKVKDYFAEMVKASGVEWVTYEDVGVVVTLTASLKSLKAKMMLDEGCSDVACNYAYEPVYTPADGRSLYEQLKIVSDYIVDNKLDVVVTILDSLLGGKAKDDKNFCGGTGAMLSFAPDGSAYPCIRYAPISIGVEKAKKVRFGSVYDGLYVTDEQKRVKADLDAITRTTQSPKECLECPVSAGCGWCSGMNYEVFGTANKRTTSICWAHKARVLASAYYYNHRYIEIGDCLPIKAELPELDALSILDLFDFSVQRHIQGIAGISQPAGKRNVSPRV